ncbi:aminopeptidase N [Bauldia litoralis]|uniref:aminopeptidase N n=1 Tax=Bauldia litoralis TaxID=665467 RepID=UPI00326493F7
MTKETTPVRLSDYRAPDYAIDTVSLDFSLAPTATQVTAQLAMRPNTPGAPLVLDGDEVKLIAISINEEYIPSSAYEATPQQLTIKAPPREPFTLEIVTEINPKANTKLMGLYLSNGNYCTQCEAEGFRRITYFLDRPDVLAVYTTRIEASKAAAPVLLSNGNRIDGGDIPGTTRHFAVWHDPFPKPSYLFAAVAGDLGLVEDSFTTMSGREVALHIYCEHGKEARCAYAMDALKRSMGWDETAFGREYDLDIFMIVAVSDFNMGAMENKGLNVFNDKYVLADPDIATDADYAGIETVIAHEYFHNWTGDRITCRDWFQLCLKEGLTVFRDQEFSSDERSRGVKRIADVRTLLARQFPEDAGPLAHPVRPEVYSEINNFYTATVYDKGAEVIRMLKAILGEDGFRAGMDLYFERHDGQAVTIEDFLASFADATGKDLSQFKLWYSQAGTPEVTAEGRYDARRQTYSLSLKQSIPPTPGQQTKSPMHIPVRFGLVGPNGADLAFTSATGGGVEDDVIHLTEAAQTIVFEGVSAPPVPSLLRGFSAPVKIATGLSQTDQLFLLRTDADAFNRWRASQQIAIQTLIAETAAVRSGAQSKLDPAFVDALAEVAEDDSLEPAFRAQILQLPGEADIAREIGHDVDPAAIAGARKRLMAMVASRIGKRLADLAERTGNVGDYSPDAASAGRRALANAALALTVGQAAPEAIGRIVARFESADNMTDRLAALSILASNGFEERIAALETFQDRYRDDPLGLDKWLMLEAVVPLETTLDRVKALTTHPAFSLTNPNRIRALIGGFAGSNQTQFNRPDGAGYDFFADFVLDLDKRNPQTAARLLVSFRSWKALEAGRRALAEKALRRIAASDSLSSDTRDIVTRTLA